MAIKTITYIPDLEHNMIPSPITLSQGDTSFEIVFDLSGFSSASNVSSARVDGNKPDKTGYTINCAWSASALTATLQGEAQITSVAGKSEIELVLIDSSGEIIGSQNIQILVERSPLGGVYVSENELSALQESVNSAAASATAAANSASDASDSASAAKTSETNAASSASSASSSASAAAISASAAKTSETNAKSSQTAAASSASAAKTSATNAAASAIAAATSETNAAASETNAKASATAAAESESNAKTYAEDAASSAGSLKQATEVVSIPTSGWTDRTLDSVSYKCYTVALTNAYDPNYVEVSEAPTGSNVLATKAQETAMLSILAWTLDDSDGKTLRLYANSVPSTAFAVRVSGTIKLS